MVDFAPKQKRGNEKGSGRSPLHKPEKTSQNQQPKLIQLKPKDLTGPDLKPEVINQLQRTHGNQFVMRLLQNRQAAGKGEAPTSHNKAKKQRGEAKGRQPSDKIQRRYFTNDEADDGMDYLENVNDIAGTLGDYLGADQGGLDKGNTGGTGDYGTGAGMDSVGTVFSLATGSIGVLKGGYDIIDDSVSLYKTNKEIDEVNEDYQDGSGDTELFATMELLKRQKSDAEKGIFEGSTSVVSGIVGILNGVGGAIGDAALSVWTFGIGAAIGAVMGTINAIRDFLDAGRREMKKQEIAKVYAGYSEVMGEAKDELRPIHGEFSQTGNEIKGLVAQKAAMRAKINDNKKRYQNKEISKKKYQRRDARYQTAYNDIKGEITTKRNRLQSLKDPLKNALEKYEKQKEMVAALSLSMRKQGNATKIGTGILSLVGAGGSAALFIAALGVGAAAAATPIGWVMAGVALVGALGFAIGMGIKRAIRKDNVKRMNDEKKMLMLYINTGYFDDAGTKQPAGLPGPGSRKKRQRENATWSRKAFEDAGLRKKGWFNKLISKSKSGSMTMKERLKELDDYLKKHDKGGAADTIAEGFIESLKFPNDPSKGGKVVKNPVHDTDPSAPAETTLADLNKGLLAYFFKSKVDEMVDSLLSDDDDKRNKAKELLATKMRLNN
jgi:hypothetical protein